MNYTQTLIDIGLPCASAATNQDTGNVDATFERSLTSQEWIDYLRVINPPTWDDIRSERVRLLSACDWTQLADAPLTDTERVTWQYYRQALRDLPQTYPSPNDVVFPEQP